MTERWQYTLNLQEGLALSSYTGLLMLVALLNPLALYFFRSPFSLAFLTLEVLLVLIPLGDIKVPWINDFNQYAMQVYRRHHDFKVIYDGEEESTFQKGKTYVIGHEPHSVLPFAISMLFGDQNGRAYSQLGQVRTLCTSVVFWVPLFRHIVHNFGGISASRKNMHKCLNQGTSICVVPGGVAECAYMEPGKDVCFLKSRFGFVKIALQHGSALIPTYCFGQNEMYKYWRIGPQILPPKIYDRLVRKLLFCPMLIYGQYGTAIPFRSKMTMIVGKPIPVPKIEDPSQEDIQKFLKIFIEQMKDLYERHKINTGHANSRLVIL